MSADNTAPSGPGDVASLGVDAAKDMVGFATKMIDELLAGVETVAHRSNKLAGSAAQRVNANIRKSPPTQPAKDASNNGALVDTQVVSQLFDLAQQVLKVAGDAAGRVLQTGLGPIEQMLDRDSHRHDDVWITIGPVAAGATGTTTFDLENTNEGPAEVTLSVINPPASMKGTIPVDRIRFTPTKALLPGATDEHTGIAHVTVAVDVPTGTLSGRYLCIVRSKDVDDLTVILGIDVT